MSYATKPQADTNWELLKIELDDWIKNNPSHKKIKQMKAFKENGYDRKQYPTKEINNIITGIITTKPWQALVGQVIGLKIKEGKLGIEDNNENNLDSYLGEPLINFLSNHK